MEFYNQSLKKTLLAYS